MVRQYSTGQTPNAVSGPLHTRRQRCQEGEAPSRNGPRGWHTGHGERLGCASLSPVQSRAVSSCCLSYMWMTASGLAPLRTRPTLLLTATGWVCAA